MTDKRYRVFISSTYSDLKDERDRVFQTLLGMDCMPAGMELFPALDEEQLKFIKRRLILRSGRLFTRASS